MKKTKLIKRIEQLKAEIKALELLYAEALIRESK